MCLGGFISDSGATEKMVFFFFLLTRSQRDFTLNNLFYIPIATPEKYARSRKKK